MLNQLSRLGDQLPRARHRMSSGSAKVLIPPARRGPTPEELARAADRELYAEDERSGRALVSIHVEVTHPDIDPRYQAALDVIQAQVVESQVIDAEAEPVAQAAPDPEPARPMLALADESALQPSAAFELTPQLKSHAFAGYASERAFGAYAAQSGFVSARAGSAGASATRLLDVRA